jgi:hypothetical protein
MATPAPVAAIVARRIILSTAAAAAIVTGWIVLSVTTTAVVVARLGFARRDTRQCQRSRSRGQHGRRGQPGEAAS